MGFIDIAPGTDIPVFYNLVKAVGMGCPNQHDDVMMVQYLLMSFYEAMPSYMTPKGNIGVTGMCGGATRNWILKFQLDVQNEYPGMIYPDGRIDRIRNKDFCGSIIYAFYTLAYLNVNVSYFNPAAFIALPGVVPLQTVYDVPPPTPDVVADPRQSKLIINKQGSMVIPETGGF